MVPFGLGEGDRCNGRDDGGSFGAGVEGRGGAGALLGEAEGVVGGGAGIVSNGAVMYTPR